MTSSADVNSSTATGTMNIPEGFTVHTENTAKILLPSETTTFLNPIQEFNRDLSVACITTWSNRWEQGKRARWEQASARREKNKKRKKNAGEDKEEQGMDVDPAPKPVETQTKSEEQGTVAASAGEKPKPETETTNGNGEEKQKEYVAPKFAILEALSATGLRAIRYAHEIPLVKYVIANDILPAATEAMRRNVELNRLGPASASEESGPAKTGKKTDLGKVRVSEMDAIALLYHHRADNARVEVVDLDPYGTAAPFIDGAVQAVADGGLLCVTCTDMAVLASNNYPEKCYANYGGVPVKAEFSHEVALRLVLHTLATSAARYGRYITPLVSLSIDFYVRVFVQVRSAPIEVKKAFSQSATYYVCSGCQSPHEQTLGRVVEKPGTNNLTYKAQSGPPIGPECDECGFKFHVAGPMWSGPIHDKTFVSEVLKHVEENPGKYGTEQRMKGMLTVAGEELDVPFYFTPSRLSGFFHCNSPPLEHVASALLHKGYEISRSHACAGSLKTTATRAQVYDIIRSWIKLNPVKMENVKDGSPTRKLLSKEPTEEANFSRHPQAISRASQVKLVRYQQNPTPNWGPGSRPNASKRKREDGTEA
ncbi:tRNA (guanine-N2-)-methyltransferase [Rhizoctonia solani AG-1 IB]|uniref:tRNA (guanine(26)-N(2))-dimethyltransferase n=1 Tax=Thanatephorus cucumeris (strain AG1-IB / isolate 7/3/14) TaxID=1108050 RepID=A0A0B7F4F3_THACB|nr:tRNA (guanine-N2-)-methyltransferase [Rhizoctonia solani AG-1 IB]